MERTFALEYSEKKRKCVFGVLLSSDTEWINRVAKCKSVAKIFFPLDGSWVGRRSEMKASNSQIQNQGRSTPFLTCFILKILRNCGILLLYFILVGFTTQVFTRKLHKQTNSRLSWCVLSRWEGETSLLHSWVTPISNRRTTFPLYVYVSRRHRVSLHLPPQNYR